MIDGEMSFPEGEIPRRRSRNSRVYKGKYLQVKYTVSMSATATVTNPNI